MPPLISPRRFSLSFRRRHAAGQLADFRQAYYFRQRQLTPPRMSAADATSSRRHSCAATGFSVEDISLPLIFATQYCRYDSR